MMNIKISHVSKIIKNNPVIKDISMELQSGAVYGFKGINGSGKTMLMRLISGLIRPSQGEISMNGKNSRERYIVPEQYRRVFGKPCIFGCVFGL